MNPASISGVRDEVAEAANVLAHLGLVTAYGHVSARYGASMLITPAADLALVTSASVLEVPIEAAAGQVLPPGVMQVLPPGVPAEAWAHLAFYQARPDIAAIARAQPASTFAAAAATSSLVPLHGQAAWLGTSVPVHDSAALLRSPELAHDAVRSLPSGEALLLRGNGAITLGAAPGLAAARMWLLSAACDAYLAAAAVAGPERLTPLTGAEVASWRAVGDELLPRLWEHLRRRDQGGPASRHAGQEER